MHAALESIGHHADMNIFKSALHSVCSQYGDVNSLEVIPAVSRGKRHALCFLRMDSLEHERRIMDELDFQRFADDLVVVVDLKDEVAAN